VLPEVAGPPTLANFSAKGTPRGQLSSNLPGMPFLASMSGAWVDPAPPKSRFATVNGVQLHYLDGEGTGPELIRVHGYTGNSHVLDDLASHFIDRFRVIAYARRGSAFRRRKGPVTLLR
jgi:hypothetical protein